jgi:hypothetical protein
MAIRHFYYLIPRKNNTSQKVRVFPLLTIAGLALSTVVLPQITTSLASPQEMLEWLKTGLPQPLPCDRVAADAVNDVLVPPFAATDLVNLAISFYTEKRTYGVVRWPKSEISEELRERYQSIGIHLPSTVEEVDQELRRMGVKTFITVNDPDLTDALVTGFNYKPVRELIICQMPSTVLYVSS